MLDGKYHLRVGDLLHNPKNMALGLIVKSTRHYFHFYLMSSTADENPVFQITEDRASKQKVYESIDSGLLRIHYGTTKRRRKRKTFYESIKTELEDTQTC